MGAGEKDTLETVETVSPPLGPPAPAPSPPLLMVVVVEPRQGSGVRLLLSKSNMFLEVLLLFWWMVVRLWVPYAAFVPPIVALWVACLSSRVDEVRKDLGKSWLMRWRQGGRFMQTTALRSSIRDQYAAGTVPQETSAVGAKVAT